LTGGRIEHLTAFGALGDTLTAARHPACRTYASSINAAFSGRTNGAASGAVSRVGLQIDTPAVAHCGAGRTDTATADAAGPRSTNGAASAAVRWVDKWFDAIAVAERLASLAAAPLAADPVDADLGAGALIIVRAAPTARAADPIGADLPRRAVRIERARTAGTVDAHLARRTPSIVHAPTAATAGTVDTDLAGGAVRINAATRDAHPAAEPLTRSASA
jgi:hypothetical protein